MKMLLLRMQTPFAPSENIKKWHTVICFNADQPARQATKRVHVVKFGLKPVIKKLDCHRRMSAFTHSGMAICLWIQKHEPRPDR